MLSSSKPSAEKPTDLKAFELDHPKTFVTVHELRQKTWPASNSRATPNLLQLPLRLRLSNQSCGAADLVGFPSGMNNNVTDLRVRDLISFKMDDSAN